MKEIEAKTILTRTKNNWWFGMDYNMNVYRGCCHGCIYCDSRSDCYHVEDFDTVAVKKNAALMLHRVLDSKHYKGIIGTGAMSDPYNPFEKKQMVMRKVLEAINYHGFGIGIATKSDLIVRDVDLLSRINQHAPVIAKFSISTADDELAKRIEPHAPLPSARYKAMEELSKQGIYTGVLMMPVLPFIEDSEDQILEMVRRAADHGAKFIYSMIGVTMRDGQREYLYRGLDLHFPGMRETYQRTYGNRYECMSKNIQKLWPVFTQECKKYGIAYEMKRIVTAYGWNKTEQTSLLFD